MQNSCPHCWGKSFTKEKNTLKCKICLSKYEERSPLLDEDFRDTLLII